MRDLVAGNVVFQTLDAVQLVKHALGLRTRAEKRARGAALVYLYAEPPHWAGSGKPMDKARIALHRREVLQFAGMVKGDQVVFSSLTWANLLANWSRNPVTKAHSAAMSDRFGDLG